VNRTFKDWSSRGYKITKGSKAVGFNEQSEALFSDKQVVKFPRREATYGRLRFGGYDAFAEGYEYEGSWEEMIAATEWYR
jgi:hypothetical protein